MKKQLWRGYRNDEADAAVVVVGREVDDNFDIVVEMVIGDILAVTDVVVIVVDIVDIAGVVVGIVVVDIAAAAVVLLVAVDTQVSHSYTPGRHAAAAADSGQKKPLSPLETTDENYWYAISLVVVVFSSQIEKKDSFYESRLLRR